MSISAISPASSIYQPSSTQSAFSQDFSQLANSITSGNLSGAQQAYSSLSQLLSSVQGPSATNPNNPLTQALGQIGQALQNGNLSGAQQALSSLQQAKGSHHSHGHHHGGGGGASTSASTSATTTAAASSTVSGTNTLNVTV
jgi:hypothetical protein